ncbi:HER055Wp [Eremothecium sinecaudum]|uniref:HER055Wp n=1 Tax=Eremothecium sinecaudum TaxID=45286 RepID=A0A0X8HTU1_9SACH|nr:HER055Wp [Eremothecium sinecaudum]AMD21334.1 HER055Wp [Eremothecium sinecaudum]
MRFLINLAEEKKIICTEGEYLDSNKLWINCGNCLVGAKGEHLDWRLDEKPFLSFIRGDYANLEVVMRDWLVVKRGTLWHIEESDYNSTSLTPKVLLVLPDVSNSSLKERATVPDQERWQLRERITDLATQLRLSKAKCKVLEDELKVTKKVTIGLLNSKKAKIRELQAALDGNPCTASDMPDEAVMHKYVTEGDDQRTSERVSTEDEPSLKRFKNNFGTPKVPHTEGFAFRGINRSLTPTSYLPAPVELSDTKRKLEAEIEATNRSSSMDDKTAHESYNDESTTESE